VVRGVRGATTVSRNDAEEITSATERLLREMIKANNIEPSDVASVLISATEDLTAGFPAAALRRIEGWNYVPVMCMREIPVPDSLPKCIRIMMMINTTKDQKGIKHIYLEKAVSLRPDLLTNDDEM
jgi:chorismate mutase